MSLTALKKMREGKTFDEACEFAGIPKNTMIRSVGSALFKEEDTWNAKRFDNISRPPMAIYTGGERKWIDVADSSTASILGTYSSMRAKYLHTLDTTVLEPFRGVVVQDVYGNKYTLDTDPELVFEAERKKREPEPQELYKYGG